MLMKKMLFVTNTMGMGGAERCLIDLLEEIDKDRYEVSVFSIVPIGKYFDNIPDNVAVLNDHCDTCEITGSVAKKLIISQALKAVGSNLSCLWGLFRNVIIQIKNRNFSVKHLLWEPLATAAPRFDTEYDIAVAYLEGAATYYVSRYVKARKKVAFVHVDYIKAGYNREFDQKYYSEFDRIYSVSKVVMQTMLSTYPMLSDRMETFQNTICDSRVINMSTSGRGFTDDYNGVRLLTIGRLHYQKAYDIAIKAFAALITTYSEFNIRWYVIGEGDERKNLEELILRYGLKDKFILLGERENPYPYIRECDIYVHATRFEGWSIAIAEAKILKKPIIATKTAGVVEMLSTGSVIIDLSEQEIVDAIYSLVTDVQLRNNLIKELDTPWERPNDISKIYRLLEDV